jgi:hypothetical protein
MASNDRVDAVEKVAARRFQFAGEKTDLSDRPTNRSRLSVKGKKTLKTSRQRRSATISTASTMLGHSVEHLNGHSGVRSGIYIAAAFEN